jgi:hypothetical protein
LKSIGLAFDALSALAVNAKTKNCGLFGNPAFSLFVNVLATNAV